MSSASLKRSATDIVAAAGRHLVGAAAGLMMIPILARTLGAEGLGAWTLVGTTSFLLGVADLGLGTCVQRAVAARDDDTARRLVGLALGVVAVVAPTLAVVAFFWLSAAVPVHVPGARLATAIALGAGVVSAASFPLRGFLLMKGGMRDLAYARALASAAQLGVTAFVLFQVSRSLVAPAMGVLAAAIAETTWITVAARRFDRALPLLPRGGFDWPFTRDALGAGAATLVVNIAFLVALRVDVLIIAEVAPLAVVAAYGIASRAVDQAFVVAKQVSAGLLPRLAGGTKDRQDAVMGGTTVMGALVAAGMTALALDGGALLEAWGGPPAREPTTWIATLLLGAAAIVAASHEVAAATLTVAGASPWSTARALAAGTALNIAISLVGARWLGVWAVAAATVAGNLVTAVLVWRRLAPTIELTRTDVIRALLPLGTALATAAPVGLLLSRFAATGPLASLGACTVTTVIGLTAGLAPAVSRWNDRASQPATVATKAKTPSVMPSLSSARPASPFNALTPGPSPRAGEGS
jgi:O-antigen/teichoic acid export membrane protein